MEEASNPVLVEYAGRPEGLKFAVGDRRVQLVHLRNGYAKQSVMFKIQSTSSRKFRVRPGLGTIAPRESIAVQVQLSPQESEPSESKFLVVVRRIDPQDIQSGTSPTARRESSATVADRAQQQRDAEDKALRNSGAVPPPAATVLTETISAQILAMDGEASNEAVQDHQVEDPAPAPAPAPAPSPPPDASPNPSVELLALDSIENRANVVVLLMKNQSNHPSNKLTVGELQALMNLRERDEDAWRTLQGYASRMRALARQYRRRQKSS